jgi:hypothetical protein
VRSVRRGDHCCVNLGVWRNLSGELPGNIVWGDLKARGLGLLRDEGVWGLGLLRSWMKGEGITHYGGIGCYGGGSSRATTYLKSERAC